MALIMGRAKGPGKIVPLHFYCRWCHNYKRLRMCIACGPLAQVEKVVTKAEGTRNAMKVHRTANAKKVEAGKRLA